jgi:hypothetical protein
MSKFDVKRLSTLDRVLVGASGLALISLFLPWYGVSAGGFSASVSGFSTSYGWLGALLIVAAGVYLALHRSEVDLSKMPLTPALVVLSTAGLGTLIVVLRWLTLPSGHVGIGKVALYSYGPRVGIYVAVIAGVAAVVCAVMMFRTSGEKLPWASKSSPAA